MSIKPRLLARFKTVLSEASKLYDTPMHRVNVAQFNTLSFGKISRTEISIVGGFGKLKQYVAPAPGCRPDKSILALIKKVS